MPFAVLRAICDPANAPCLPAALAALDARGVIGVWRVLASLAAQPGQLPALLALAADAAAARRSLVARVRQITLARGSRSFHCAVSTIRSCGMMARTVVPWPGVLSIVNVPPCRVSSLRLIARPSPVPPNFRPIEASAC